MSVGQLIIKKVGRITIMDISLEELISNWQGSSDELQSIISNWQ